MNPAELWELVKKSVNAWIDDFAPSMGAAIAYYTLFSVAPLLILVVAVAGMLFGHDAVRGELATQMSALLGESAAEAVQDLVESASDPAGGVIATAVSVVMLLVGATTVFAELQSALDRIWRVPAPQTASGFIAVLQARVLSFGLILGIGFLLLVSLVISAGVAAFGKWYGGVLPGWELLLQGINFAISFLMSTLLFAMIYKIMPRARIAWRDVWIGAAVTSLLFNIGKILIGLYIGKSSVASGFAAAGSLVVLLIWVYYSAQVFLLGAEFTWVYAHSHGSKSDEPPPGEAPDLPSRSEGDAPPRSGPSG